MNTLRVPCRGGGLWFVLGAMLFAMATIIAIAAIKPGAWLPFAIFSCLAVSAISWGLYGAKRYIDFGDRIIVCYWLRRRVVSWEEVTFVSFERTEGQLRTGIPFVGIPFENQFVRVRLKDGGVLNADVEPSQFPAISKIVEQNATLDIEREERRLAAEQAWEQRSLPLMWAAFGMAFCAMGVWFAVSMAGEIVDGTNSHSWPEAPTKINIARVISETKYGDGGRTTTFYRPDVQYTYTVKNEEHRGSRYMLSPTRSQEIEDIENRIRSLRNATDIKVRYKPGEPSVAVLMPGIEWHRYVFFGVLVVGGCAAFVFSVVNFRRYIRIRATPSDDDLSSLR